MSRPGRLFFAMTSSNDIRADLPRLLRRARPRGRAELPLVPRNDPTLLFTNAGMVQFKNVFTGQEAPALRRATTAQKCVRAGGKHNDLDNVGYTARHHTFFEMLGNFSFGDYFKPDAIELAWTLLTRTSACRATSCWSRSIPRTRRPPPCGARSPGCRTSASSASRPPTISGAWATPARAARARRSSTTTATASRAARRAAPDEDGDRFIEIWNLVFMQYEEGPPGTRTPLPRPSIDTGMGLERFAAILQGVHDNYDTDTFRALILASAEATGQAGRPVPDQPPRGGRPPAQRVVPDRRRRAAVQRGPRLRAAPDHAPRDAAPAHDGRAASRCSIAWCRRWCARWARPTRSWCAPRR